MVKIVTFLVPGKEEEHGPGALFTLDENILGQLVFAIRMFGEELQKFMATPTTFAPACSSWAHARATPSPRT